MQFRRLLIQVFALLTTSFVAPLQGSELLNTSEILTFVKTSSMDDLVLARQEIAPDADLNRIKHALLLKLIACSAADEARIAEHLNRALTYKGRTMRFSFDEIGEPTGAGFPLYITLHGGGSSGSWVNDSQWQAMKYYYRNSIHNGIHVATRGITDNWNLHFEDESYPLYARLIANMVLFENVDPNRVYLLGFSAGGDGVYQIATRMADRFAGANMSAGHSNQVDLANLRNVAFLMQMGEHDFSFGRNRNVVESLMALQRLQGIHGGYVHRLNLHKYGSHNSWMDNNPSGTVQMVLKDPIAWYATGNEEAVAENTNAVHWLKDRSREPQPERIVWNTAVAMPRSTSPAAHSLSTPEAKNQLGTSYRLFYWLDANKNPDEMALGQIVASYCREENRIDIESIEDGVHLKILVNDAMVDFSKPVTVAVKGKVQRHMLLRPCIEVMARTLLEREDPNFCFQAEIELSVDGL